MGHQGGVFGQAQCDRMSCGSDGWSTPVIQMAHTFSIMARRFRLDGSEWPIPEAQDKITAARNLELGPA